MKTIYATAILLLFLIGSPMACVTTTTTRTTSSTTLSTTRLTTLSTSSTTTLSSSSTAGTTSIHVTTTISALPSNPSSGHSMIGSAGGIPCFWCVLAGMGGHSAGQQVPSIRFFNVSSGTVWVAYSNGKFWNTGALLR